jgi:hypothetical protein
VAPADSAPVAPAVPVLAPAVARPSYAAAQFLAVPGRDQSQPGVAGTIFDRGRAAPRPLGITDSPGYGLWGPSLDLAGYADPQPPTGWLLGAADAYGAGVFDTAHLDDVGNFRPAAIPVRTDDYYGVGRRASVVSPDLATRVALETTQPVDPTEIRFFSQLAFTGAPAGDGLSNSTAPPGSAGQVRVLHAYGQVGGWVMGKADSFFTDPFAFPTTLDTAGPNALVYAQQPLIGRMDYFPVGDRRWVLTAVSVEGTVTPVIPDPNAVGKFRDRVRLPAVAAHVGYGDKDWGYIRLAGIVRDVGLENTPFTATTGPLLGPHL